MSENGKKTIRCVFCNGEHDSGCTTCEVTGKNLTIVHKLSGRVFENKYRIGRFIGEGGMGVIYEAEHTGIGKKLAIKFLNPQLRKNDEAYERFKREAMASAMIAHQNIVNVIDIGETPDEKIPYIIMEYLSGEDLSQRIAKWGRIPFMEAKEIMIQVLEALSAVHSCGIVHRDLKPENIFLHRQSGGSEIVKVLDFGISRLSRLEGGEVTRLTKAGYVYGTPNYISPEQAEGKANVDHRADLYSAGIIFYEMLTGQLPFTGETYGKLLLEIISKPPPDPRNYLPEIPQSVVDFINTSLEKDPNLRFYSAQEMIREIKALQYDSPRETSYPPSYSSSRQTPSSSKRTTPVKEIVNGEHRDFSTPSERKRTSSSSFYRVVTGSRKSTHSKLKPDIEKEKEKKTPFMKLPSKSDNTKPETGVYRISHPPSERVYGTEKLPSEKKEESKDLQNKKTKDAQKAPPISPPPKVVQPLGEIHAIERARTLPTPISQEGKKNSLNGINGNNAITPTPDKDKDSE